MTQVRPMNILLVSLDDCLAWHRHACDFGEPLRTPNLDRIAAVSAQFRAAYCQVPICGPSRASFMSARTPHETGVFTNEDDVFDRLDATAMWPYRLKAAGWFCSSGGKVHHGYKPLRRRIHEVLYSDGQKRFGDDMSLPPGVARRKYGGIRGGWGTTDEKDDHIFYDARSSASAIDFLQTYDGAAPFYREVGFFSPHGPRFTPARFKDMYDVTRFHPPEAWAEGHDETAFSRQFMPETERLSAGDLDWWRANVRNYFAALSHGDHHLGRVWDALKASRHAGNTLVVILSDHGFLLGARNRFYKSTLWEPSVGVPFIVHDPARPARAVDDPVALVDVGPTVLDFAGLAPIPGTRGRSLRPLVEGADQPPRAIPSFRNDSVTVRSGRYRIIRYGDGSSQLFDLETDPWTLRDLGPRHPAFAEMGRVLHETCREWGAELPATG